MNNKFDELTKAMAQSVTRRAALRKFSVGLAGIALACFGLAQDTNADPKPSGCGCVSDADCNGKSRCNSYGVCVPSWCATDVDGCCCFHTRHGCGTALPTCAPNYTSCFDACTFGQGC